MTYGDRRWAAILLCLLCMAVLAATGVLNRQKVWASVPLDEVRGKLSFSIEEGDARGRVSAGPYWDLPAGTYRIKWQIEGDGDNAIAFKSSNDARIEPDRVTVQAGQWEGEAVFSLLDTAHNFSIETEFVSGSTLQVYNIRLYSPEYTDYTWLACFLLAGLTALYLLRGRCRLIGETKEAAVVLGIAVVFALLPALRTDTLNGHDVQYHAARLMNLADGLKSGQFPVRAGGFSYNGYGAVTSAFYPDLLLYPFALMLLGGASISFVLNVIRAVLVVGMALSMYAAALRVLRDRHTALCAAILYICSPYTMTGVYESFMLGQMLAMVFLPIFLYALWQVLWQECEKWPLLAATATLIFQSHRLSTLLCAGLAAVAFLMRLPVLWREKRISSILKAVGLALLLNLSSIVPLATLYASGVNTSVVQFGFAGKALSLTELLAPDKWVGLPVLLGTAAWAMSGVSGAKPLRLCALVGGATMLLSSTLVPWNYAAKVIGGLLETIQFPWRFLVLGTPMLALCAGAGFARVFGGQRHRAALLALALCALCVWPGMDALEEKYGLIEFGTGANVYMVQPEYQIEGTDVHDTRSRQPAAAGGVTIVAYEKDGTQVRAQVSAEEGGTLTLPLFGFDGYRAELCGETIDWTLGENNRLMLMIPAGTQGEVRVWYAGKAIWRAFDGISLAVLLLLAARTIQGRREKKLKAAA